MQQVNTVIFDMDGLLIDSEPFWQQAGMETLQQFNAKLAPHQYHHTTGLRTREWLDYWFGHFGISKDLIPTAEADLHRNVIEKIKAHADPMPGIEHIFDYFKAQKFRIGLATSSPLSLVDEVLDKLKIRSFLEAIASAEHLPFGKPHPQVYMDCAQSLGVSPLQCICFEDSFNGMIAGKAARMKCVVIPTPTQYDLPKWGAADLRLPSLADFGDKHLAALAPRPVTV